MKNFSKMNLIKLMPLVVLLATGCALSKRAEIGIYTLDTNNIKPVSAAKCAADLQVIEPTTSPGLDGRRIAVMQEGNKLNYYNNVRWVESVPAIVQNYIVESFEISNVYDNVTSDTDTANADILLLTDIRNFEVTSDETGYPLIRMRIVSKLVNRADYKVIKTITAEENIKPSENKIASIIDAFSEGTGKMAGKIIKASGAACK